MSDLDDSPIVNDAITSDDAGFSSDVGSAEMEAENEGDTVSGEVQAETASELQEEIQEAIEEGASEEEVKQMIRQFTIKVNGKEKNVEIDLNDTEALVKKLQLAEASQLAMQERRELQKRFEDLEKRFVQDPFSLMEEAGLDPLQLAEMKIKQEIEERKKSPELREKEKIERELELARAELRKREEEADRARREQLQSEAASELDKEISEALDAHPSLPRTEGTIAKIADMMLWTYDHAEELGVNPEDIRVEHVIPAVEKEIRMDIQALLNQLPEDGVEELLGSQVLEKMRKKRLNSVKPSSVNQIKSTTQSIAKKEDASEKARRKAKDYFRNL
jgi:hypothetical protein